MFVSLGWLNKATFQPRSVSKRPGLFNAQPAVLLLHPMSEKDDMAPLSSPTAQPAKKRKPPKNSELRGVDWAAIEPAYCAGVVSLNSLAKSFGVSRMGIAKHADKHGWIRATQPQILARAEELVATSPEPGVVAVYAPINADEREKAINLGAAATALVLMDQRKSIQRVRTVGEKLLAELELSIDHPEIGGMVYDALSKANTRGRDAEGWALLLNVADLIASLPERAKVLKTLTDTLSMAVMMERKSYGLDRADADETGVPTAIVKDYTGTDDEDSPGFDTDRDGDA